MSTGILSVNVSAPSSSQYKALVVHKSGISNLCLCPGDSSTPSYFCNISNWTVSKPAIVFHDGDSTKGAIKGVIHMHTYNGHYTVGLGDPIDERSVKWENFERMRIWNPIHRWSCDVIVGVGDNGEVKTARRTYEWRKPGAWWQRVGDMELVEVEDNEEVGKGEDGEADRGGKEVLVRYDRPKTALGKVRGRFEIKEGMGYEWEMMVLLTGMGLVLIHRRNTGK